VNGHLRHVAWYRLRATFRHRRGGYLSLVLLLGLIGGIAMGSIAAARRTQSSYPRFLASTNPSDLTMSTYGISSSSATSYSPTLAKAIAHLTDVKRVESWVGLFVAPLTPEGAPNFNPSVNVAGSLDGLYFDEDRATAVEGRMANPNRVDEFVTTTIGAHLLGVHVGQVVPVGLYTAAQGNLPGFGTPAVPPAHRIDMKLVGTVVFNDEVIEDAADRLPTNVLFTPALTHLVATGDTQGTWYGLQLVHGSADVPAVERALLGLIPPGGVSNFRVTSPGEAKVERAVKPEAIALGVFGAIAALAALAIAVQAISRQLRAADEDLTVLRALGASPATIVVEGLIGNLGSVALGSLLACAVAVGLSRFSPLGPVRRVYPSPGIAADWTVLGIGLVVLVGGLGSTAVVLAYLRAPHRLARQSQLVGARRSNIVSVAAASGLSAPAVVGVRFALEPGQGRTAVPVRSALFGTALAVGMVIATLTFGSGLHTLVSRPSLYGWDWSYALTSSYNVPPQARALLQHDPDVAAWAGYHDFNLQIDGRNVPVLFGDDHPALTPPILSGHAVDGNDQIVLGAVTLARLGKHVGDTVVVAYGTPQGGTLYVPPTTLTIVGTATLPAIVASSTLADHTSMGVGALLSTGVVPTATQQAISNPDPTLNGPPIVFVRIRPRVAPAAGLADMQRIADAANSAFAADPAGGGAAVEVLSVQRPGEIVNYRSTGATPVILAAGLAAGAIVALGLTLAASVRRRRQDLALLKTLGFTKRQLAAAVAWQASVAAVVGVAIGVPLGIAVGRQLWILFARNIDVVPQPTVPMVSVVLVALGAVVLANVVAALPGRSAARTPAAQVLRTG
jgi:hypothetical protein